MIYTEYSTKELRCAFSISFLRKPKEVSKAERFVYNTLVISCRGAIKDVVTNTYNSGRPFIIFFVQA